MNEQRVYDEAPFRPQGLQMPQQAPPVDRREAGPGPVAEGDGVAASGILSGLGQMVDNLFPF
ncbi:hypothetical protein [Streptomyces umbrinus]|uniref:hypothetical protein n=1 Tax=Streptomyces umbrinus TaxID=67370 RepID=UPI0033C08A31